MIRLVPLSIYESVRARARRFTLETILPQHDSIPGVLTIACRQRAANDWSCWIVDPFLTGNRFAAWCKGHKPAIPTWHYDYSAERGPVIWLNSLPQRYMLSVRVFIVETRQRWEPLRHLEVLAYVPTSADLQRIIVHDRSTVDGLCPNKSPLIRAGRPAMKFTPTGDLRRHAEALHAAYQPDTRILIEKAGIRRVKK